MRCDNRRVMPPTMNGAEPMLRARKRSRRAALLASLGIVLALAACGASGGALPAGSAPPPGLMTFESIYSGSAESVSLATLTADMQKSLTESTILPTTVIPNVVPNATQSLSSYEQQPSDTATLSAQQACYGLVLNYYAAYKLSFGSSSYSGADLLYQVARETYWYCVGPQGAYASSTGFKGQLQVAWNRGVVVTTP